MKDKILAQLTPQVKILKVSGEKKIKIEVKGHNM